MSLFVWFSGTHAECRKTHIPQDGCYTPTKGKDVVAAMPTNEVVALPVRQHEEALSVP